MSSSDSEDGYYSNVVKNREMVREQYRKKLLANTGVVAIKSAATSDRGNSTSGNTESTTSNAANVVKNTTNSSLIDSIEDDMILDEIIARNSKPAPRTRGRKKKESIIPSTTAEPVATKSRGRGRGMGSKRGRASKKNVADMGISNSLDSFGLLNGRGRRNRSSVISTELNNLIDKLSSTEELLQSLLPVNVNSRGSGRKRGRGRSHPTANIPNLNPIQTIPNYPTYSVGNTDEYPDMSDDVPLFSKPSTNTTHEIIDLDQTITDNADDNELLSVKVIWKSQEVFKFAIRKYQKITQIFESFAKKENIGKDKLLFTYNNKILTREDTPASIDYNIAKFIDGGVVSHSVQNIFNSKSIINGIKIKFQCQNIKKPLEVMIGNDDKVSLAMTQCAERLEVPLNKLKFEFDGDIVVGTCTPQQMGLEDGDCVDVMILS